jgi:hypothetical protein
MKKETKCKAYNLSDFAALELTPSKMMSVKGGFNPQPDPPGKVIPKSQK